MGRFINADAFASTGQGLLGNNMYAYCLNNPVNRTDVGGMLSVECYRDDGDLFDRMLEGSSGGGYGGIVADAIGTVVTVGALFAEVPSSSREDEKVVAIADTEKSTIVYIYRHRGTNPGNLVPTKRDVQFNSGLSFSTTPQPNSFKTTIELINATGLLLAVQDGPTHVSVYPIGGTISDWREAGTSSVWTQALLYVCTKYYG